MATQYHVNPRFRAYGKARLDIASRAQSRDEWEDLWKPPIFEFPFEWGRYWKHCVEYRVDDYAAEVGFFIDVLGFPVNAFDPNYAQFTSPDGEFFIAVVPSTPEHPATPPNALRLQFMIQDLELTASELSNRGVVFEQPPAPLQPGSQLMMAIFRSPHGLVIELWGEQAAATRESMAAPVKSRQISTSSTVAKSEENNTTPTKSPVQIRSNKDPEDQHNSQSLPQNQKEQFHIPALDKLKRTNFGTKEQKQASTPTRARLDEENSDSTGAPHGQELHPWSDPTVPEPIQSGLVPVRPPASGRKPAHVVRRGTLKNRNIRLADHRAFFYNKTPCQS